jgi:hypothetical protein
VQSHHGKGRHRKPRLKAVANLSTHQNSCPEGEDDMNREHDDELAKQRTMESTRALEELRNFDVHDHGGIAAVFIERIIRRTELERLAYGKLPPDSVEPASLDRRVERDVEIYKSIDGWKTENWDKANSPQLRMELLRETERRLSIDQGRPTRHVYSDSLESSPLHQDYKVSANVPGPFWSDGTELKSELPAEIAVDNKVNLIWVSAKVLSESRESMFCTIAEAIFYAYELDVVDFPGRHPAWSKYEILALQAKEVERTPGWDWGEPPHMTRLAMVEADYQMMKCFDKFGQFIDRLRGKHI